jgi:hypothetical protein
LTENDLLFNKFKLGVSILDEKIFQAHLINQLSSEEKTAVVEEKKEET